MLRRGRGVRLPTSDLSPIGDVPQSNRPLLVAARCQGLAVWGESDAIGHAGMRPEKEQPLAAGHVPEANVFVEAAGNERLTVRRKIRHAQVPVVMADTAD